MPRCDRIPIMLNLISTIEEIERMLPVYEDR